MEQLRPTFTRRELLAGAIGLTLTIPAISLLESSPQIEQGFGFGKAIDWARKFDKLHDLVPKDKITGIKTQEDIDYWEAEITPFFDYEGITDKVSGSIYGQSDTDTTFTYYEGGLQFNHVLGQTSMFTGHITLSERFSNPISPWYGREDSITTLIHEIAHTSGIYTDGEVYDEESSAQLVMLEISAAMANKGNTLMVAPLLDELRWMSLSAGKFLAMRDGRMEEWMKVRNELFPNAIDQASMDKADRYWKDDPERLQYILETYNYKPIEGLYDALQGDGIVEGVKLPINWLADYANSPSYNMGYYISPTPLPDATPTPTPTPYPTKGLNVDDLRYFVDNCEAIVKSL